MILLLSISETSLEYDQSEKLTKGLDISPVFPSSHSINPLLVNYQTDCQLIYNTRDVNEENIKQRELLDLLINYRIYLNSTCLEIYQWISTHEKLNVCIN